LCSFPFTNLSERKIRPALVISNEKYHAGGTVLLAGIYSKDRVLAVPLARENLTKKKLAHDSFVSLQNIVSIESRMLGPVIDTINPTLLEKISNDIKSLV
jgi:mRNA-degrading endonuclease toxin of MazEF toxin-antitoxin module